MITTPCNLYMIKSTPSESQAVQTKVAVFLSEKVALTVTETGQEDGVIANKAGGEAELNEAWRCVSPALLQHRRHA